MRQTPSIPRKGTETSTRAFPFLLILSQTPSIPRKGTETSGRASCHGNSLSSDTLNSPQGDGNGRLGFWLWCCEGATSDTLNSPQGDGNEDSFPCLIIPGSVRHPQFPARGRKLNRSSRHNRNSPKCQTPSIPRKGTETLGFVVGVVSGSRVRHPQFPARGRKQRDRYFRPCVNDQSDTLNSPQGDGNDKVQGLLEDDTIFKSDTLNSPQGDGNVAPFVVLLFLRFCQTPSIPRKGTETEFATHGHLQKSGHLSDTLNSPQGDGNWVRRDISNN